MLYVQAIFALLNNWENIISSEKLVPRASGFLCLCKFRWFDIFKRHLLKKTWIFWKRQIVKGSISQNVCVYGRSFVGLVSNAPVQDQLQLQCTRKVSNAPVQEQLRLECTRKPWHFNITKINTFSFAYCIDIQPFLITKMEIVRSNYGMHLYIPLLLMYLDTRSKRPLGASQESSCYMPLFRFINGFLTSLFVYWSKLTRHCNVSYLIRTCNLTFR